MIVRAVRVIITDRVLICGVLPLLWKNNRLGMGS